MSKLANGYEIYEKMKLSDLRHHIDRLGWAAENSPDELWREAHSKDKAVLEAILERKTKLSVEMDREFRRLGREGE